MANEVRSQRLMQFLQVASNPALAPFAKFQYVIREIAKAMDLDPDKVTNNMDEAARTSRAYETIPSTPRQSATTATTTRRYRPYGPHRGRWSNYWHWSSTNSGENKDLQEDLKMDNNSNQQQPSSKHSATSSRWSTTSSY